MIPNRSILLVTLPSLALILGFVWLRRKKSGDHCDTGGNNKSRIKAEDETTTTETTTTSVEPKDEIGTDLKRSQSLPCANNTSSKRDSIDRSSGKSAPIDIAPNPRSPPIKLTEKQIDSEILKLKLEESDLKNLKSIQELEDDLEGDSPVDLPGSVERRRFSLSPTNQEPPVVIKATMTAKVSPKGSFAETKYNGERDSGSEECGSAGNQSPVTGMDENANKHTDGTNGLANGHATDHELEQNGNGEEMPCNEPIASPPLSLCSLRSTDSGKGSSPPHSEGGGALTSIYDFVVPNSVVHHLIGAKGRYVKQLKVKTGVNMTVKRHPTSKNLRICTMDGTQKEIDAALRMIRQKLPESRYPQVTLERVIFLAPHAIIPLPAMDSSCLQLQLIEGINNDVVISYVVSGGQVFLQQPLHPTFPQLNVLQNRMNQSYVCSEAPHLLEIVEDAVCAVPVLGIDGATNWYRVQIISHNPETETCVVKYLDYGGYVTVLTQALRQIRTDFMTVPFQAIQVLLGNIKPIGVEWSQEAAEVLYSLTSGMVLQAQVSGYTEEGIPEVYLYASYAKDNVVFINQELVARGLAEWVPQPQLQYNNTTATDNNICIATA